MKQHHRKVIWIVISLLACYSALHICAKFVSYGELTNESKTKTMLVAGKRLHKKMSSTSLTVHVNSVELEQVQSHKLLGVIIDTQLNFNEHIM